MSIYRAYTEADGRMAVNDMITWTGQRCAVELVKYARMAQCGLEKFQLIASFVGVAGFPVDEFYKHFVEGKKLRKEQHDAQN